MWIWFGVDCAGYVLVDFILLCKIWHPKICSSHHTIIFLWNNQVLHHFVFEIESIVVKGGSQSMLLKEENCLICTIHCTVLLRVLLSVVFYIEPKTCTEFFDHWQRTHYLKKQKQSMNPRLFSMQRNSVYTSSEWIAATSLSWIIVWFCEYDFLKIPLCEFKTEHEI